MAIKSLIKMIILLSFFYSVCFASDESPSPLLVFSSQKEHIIKPVLDAFTAETGIATKLHFDNAGPLLEKLKRENSGDVLLAVDAGNLWLAQKANILKSLSSDILNTNIPTHLRAPTNEWFGFSIRARTIVYDPRKVNDSQLTDYADLADKKWKGKLCLRTSQHVYNQSLVAILIEQYGEAKTEQIIKGWISNLAGPTYASDTQLLEAMELGKCEVGISNSYYLGRLLREKPTFPVKIFWPKKETGGVHVNIFGGGLLAKSNNMKNGQKLLEWLSQTKAQELLAKANLEFPVKSGVALDPIVKSWGDYSANSTNLVVAGERQAQAVRLMDRANYK